VSDVERTKPLPTQPPTTAPEPAPLVGQVIDGRYRVTAVVGAGGVGAVYEAVHLATGRSLALKTLLPGKARAADAVARFEREARAQSLLDHPNIVEVLALGMLDDGTLYLVMELVRGEPLRALVDRGPLGPRRALVIARQVLEALAYAHARGFVHRDLKPDNVMIARVGDPGREWEQVKLVDFGLVKVIGDAADEVGAGKLTQTGVVFGTPAYMSPEQALGRPVDGRTDLYALGIVLFEMLVGRPPFPDGDPMTLMRLHISQAPPRLADAVPGAAATWATPALEALVARALAKRPDDRFAGATAMIAALDEAFRSLDHLPASG
jgi:serine/threonine-protein kinase